MQNTATSSSTTAQSIRPQVGTFLARMAVVAEPAMAPTVAPAAMKPNRRLPCAFENTSTMVAQKIDTTNRLKIDSQTKNTRPIHIAPFRRRQVKRQREGEDVGGEEPIGDRHEARPRHALHQVGEGQVEAQACRPASP